MTDLPLIGETEIRVRYRTLVKLSYDVGWRGKGQERGAGVVRDIRGYLRYVQLSLETVVDGTQIPGHEEPPVLDRPDAGVWRSPQVSDDWTDPADGC
ncbi:hypothetical protein ABZ953_14845 [Streptomyces sp. NPDC046465]|uniref:hypothetical protein n=1 Tax=Streptomyces sp. NPDC046465 TaxID=3155810 RepID=UPI0033D83291